MTYIIRGTTPHIKIEMPEGLATTDVAELWLTVTQGCRKLIDKELADMEAVDDGHVVRLTQQETLKLCATNGEVDVQARLRTVSGDAIASRIERVSAGRILKDGVI